MLVKVERALPLISPAYDVGATEPDLSAKWEQYWETLWKERHGRATS